MALRRRLPCSDTRGEATIADADTDTHIGHGIAHELDDTQGHGMLAAEVARRATRQEGERTWFGGLEARHHLRHAAHGRFELATIASGVVIDDAQRWADSLCLASAMTLLHPCGCRCWRARDDPVGVQHRDGFERRSTCGHHRPVGAPHHCETWRRCAGVHAAIRSAATLERVPAEPVPAEPAVQLRCRHWRRGAIPRPDAGDRDAGR